MPCLTYSNETKRKKKKLDNFFKGRKNNLILEHLNLKPLKWTIVKKLRFLRNLKAFTLKYDYKYFQSFWFLDLNLCQILNSI